MFLPSQWVALTLACGVPLGPAERDTEDRLDGAGAVVGVQIQVRAGESIDDRRRAFKLPKRWQRNVEQMPVFEFLKLQLAALRSAALRKTAALSGSTLGAVC